MADSKFFIHKLLFLSLFLSSIVPFTGYIVITIMLIHLLYKGEINLLPKEKNEKIFIVTFVVFLIITILNSNYKWDSLLGFYIVFINIVLYLLIRKYYKSVKENLDILKGFILCSIIVSIIGIIQFYFLKNIVIPSSWIDNRVYSIEMRAFSTLLNPNILGGYLLLIISLTIGEIENRQKNKLNLLILFLASYCLVLTYSRSAWITLFIIIIVSILFRKKTSYFIYGIFYILLIILIGQSGFERLSIDNALHDSSISYRMAIYKAAIRIIKENFILGTGLNTMKYYINGYSDYIKAPVYHAHNIILNICCEVGFVGLLFFVIIVVAISKDLIYIKNYKGCFSLFLCILSVLIQGIFDAVLITPQFLLFFTYIIGVIRNFRFNRPVVYSITDYGGN